jgi:hypothetical protein
LIRNRRRSWVERANRLLSGAGFLYSWAEQDFGEHGDKTPEEYVEWVLAEQRETVAELDECCEYCGDVDCAGDCDDDWDDDYYDDEEL